VRGRTALKELLSSNPVASTSRTGMLSSGCEYRFRNTIFGSGEVVQSNLVDGVDRKRFRTFIAGYWPRLLAVILFVLIAITLFGIAMSRGLNRDENQFIAAGALFARQGLLPYRDYPYFHVPNLMFIYAALFRCSSYLLLTSRLFSVLCALASLLIIYGFAARRLDHLTRGARFGVAAAVTICAFANPLFRYTYWRAWNHSFPVLLTMLAFLCYLESRARTRPARWLFATGLLTSLAVGSRLTLAPAAFAFLLVILCENLRRPAWQRTGWFCAGFALAILPTLVLFSLAPDQFIFGNFTYNSELYPGFCAGNGLGKEMTLGFKLLYCVTHILANPGNAALAVGLAYFFIRSRSWQFYKGSWSLPLLICALFFGGLAAAIPLPQYFYAPVPLIVLGLAMAISRTRPIGRPDYLLLSLVTIVCLASTIIDFRYSVRLFQPDRWSTLKVHSTGSRLTAATGGGKIFALAPVFPLEGGLQIYPELTAEPFAFRNGSALPAAERLRQKMLGPDELPDLLAEQPPKGILVGTEPLVEGPVIGFAKTHNYRPEPIGLGLTLFLPDSPR
jgi:4-amino-4-deoxy-L-arabinose transferase-like glycosyltransferase